MVSLVGKDIIFKPVDIDDAEFIYSLRTHPVVSKYLSPVSLGVQGQIDYILRYKELERAKKEYYFVICLKDGTCVGAIRIYDLRVDSFCWGSWMVSPDAPVYVGIESILMVYEFAFDYLKYPKSHFDAIKENSKVVAFHKKFGALVVQEDETRYYFILSREAYENAKNRYSKYYQPIVLMNEKL